MIKASSAGTLRKILVKTIMRPCSNLIQESIEEGRSEIAAKSFHRRDAVVLVEPAGIPLM